MSIVVSRVVRAVQLVSLALLVFSCGDSKPRATTKELTAFSLRAADNPMLAADVTATINGTAIAATVPYGTSVTALVATFTSTGDSVSVGGVPQVSGATANDFAAPVTYHVTAADASTKDYIVTITVAPSMAKELTAFSFLAADNAVLAADVTATINGTAIGATVPYGTNVTALVATFSTTGASIAVGGAPQTSGVTANDFTNPVSYRVTAADGSTKDYTVTVTIAPSPAKEITAFSFRSVDNAGLAADVTATINGTAIAATVPYGTNVTGLVATFSTTGVGVAVGSTPQTSGVTANDFTSPVVYRVTAADSSTKDYTVTVTIAPNPAKDITAFSFRSVDNAALPADVTATITGTTIAATVPYGTNVTGLVATFSTTGASVDIGGTPQTSGMTANDFTSPVVYRVTAADSSTKDYTVTVTVAPNPAKDITAFSFRTTNNAGLSSDVTATITGTTITATVPYGTNITALVATFTTTGASVSVGGTLQTSDTTANDFTNPVTYRVTAADTSTKDYTVTITVNPSVHNTIPFSSTTVATGCSYNNQHAIAWLNLGTMTWKACIVEASKRSAMLTSEAYTVTPGWFSHRNGANAMTGLWSNYQQAAITTTQNCIIGRDPIATGNAAPLANTVVYDGETWHYQDLGPMNYDTCATAASNAGAMIITPYTIGMTGDNYWVNSVHMCNTYEWITGNGTSFSFDNLAAYVRSSVRSCMVGYVDN